MAIVHSITVYLMAEPLPTVALLQMFQLGGQLLPKTMPVSILVVLIVTRFSGNVGIGTTNPGYKLKSLVMVMLPLP